MAVFKVINVATRPSPDDAVRGFSLDFPVAGSLVDAYAINLQGWFVPRIDAAELRLVLPGTDPRPLPSNMPRPDVSAVYPGVPSAVRSGFEVSQSIITFPQEFELYLRAAVPGDEDLWLASVHCRRQPLPTMEEPRFNPLMLTTLGRTGGTWVNHLLGCHPEIATMRPFEYESRIASYWMDIFASLAEPKSFFQSIGAGGAEGTHWWLGDERAAGRWGWMLRGRAELGGDDRSIAHWFGKQNVEQTLSAFLERITRTYELLAHDKPGATFFMERYWPHSSAQRIMSEIYPKAREIVLVRDPRDMVASILAFNKKRKQELFGRDAWDSDEAFIRSDFLGKQMRGLLYVQRERAHMNYLLRYEDLMAQPAEALESLLTYIGVANDRDVVDEMLQSSEAIATAAQRAHRTTETAQASIGRWKRDLDEPLQAACEDVFGDILSELGYGKTAGQPATSSV